jgi:hypothetical protein
MLDVAHHEPQHVSLGYCVGKEGVEPLLLDCHTLKFPNFCE